MRFFVLASMVVAAASLLPGQSYAVVFENFIAKYNRHYATEFEKGRRFQIFSENLDEIYASNAKNRSYTLGITANTDRTFEEWRASHLTGFKPALTAEKKDRPRFKAAKEFEEPNSIDWEAKGGVTSVKNQGTCGSCWAFSAVGALEGAMFVGGRTMVDLSVQHILAGDTGGYGCDGGFMTQAFDWVARNGVPSLNDEPYLCQDGMSDLCQSMSRSACNQQADVACNQQSDFCKKVQGSVCVFGAMPCFCSSDLCFKGDGTCGAPVKPAAFVLPAGDLVNYTVAGHTEMALEAAVAQQPVSVAIEADSSVFQHYTGGVLTNDACGSTLDHGVLAVGYGVDNGQKYWKVKNSWGINWGENGYIRIEKGDAASGGECGIRKAASFPTLKKASSDEIVV